MLVVVSNKKWLAMFCNIISLTLSIFDETQKCVKRGPLGACLQTETRTAENDNDKSLKYFRDPSESIRQKDSEMRSSVTQSEEGNLLIEKLRRQSEENKEKNDLLVKQKTLLNDQVGYSKIVTA